MPCGTNIANVEPQCVWAYQAKSDWCMPSTNLSSTCSTCYMEETRAIAAKPEKILMDEPCSALDLVATAKVEELIDMLKESIRSSSVKLSEQGSFVTGGYTQPAGQRKHMGAVLVGVYENGKLDTNPGTGGWHDRKQSGCTYCGWER